MNRNLKFGLKLDQHNKFCISKKIYVNNEELPPFVNILNQIGDIEINEQLYNDCTANAIQKQIEIMTKLKHKHILISVLYQYYNSRIIENHFRKPLDEGCMLENCFDALKRFYFIDDKLYPYHEHSVNECPKSELYVDSHKNRHIIVEIEKVQNEISVLKFYLAI